MYTSFDNTGILKVLSYLKSHNSEFLSGQDLSDVLKISRVAVWKDVKKKRSLGYKVESKHYFGYKLTDSTDLLLPFLFYTSDHAADTDSDTLCRSRLLYKT